MIASHGILYAKGGIVHLLDRSELPEKVLSLIHIYNHLPKQLFYILVIQHQDALATFYHFFCISTPGQTNTS